MPDAPHTPTTEEVRGYFVNGKSEEMYSASWIDDCAVEFDRWFADAIRAAKAEASELGARHIEMAADLLPGDPEPRDDEYRRGLWLAVVVMRGRAAAYSRASSSSESEAL